MPQKIIDPERPKASKMPLWRRMLGITSDWCDKSKWHVYELIDGPWWFWVRKTGPVIERDEDHKEDPDEIIATGVSFDEAKRVLEEERAAGYEDDDGALKTRDWFVMLPSEFRPSVRCVEI